MKLELVVATRNKKKLREIRDILKGEPVRLTSLADHPGCPRITEDRKTFRENAAKKACVVARYTHKLCMGEDSGLCVAALGGGPGVYSARFAGRSKDDAKNNRKLLKCLEGVRSSRRNARYVCAVALADASGLIGVVEGTCAGRIGFAPQGTFGFGYDPLFVIPRYTKTFAQLGPQIKHRMSHRFRALKKARRLIHAYSKKQSAR